MNAQIIVSPTGERLVVLPEAEFETLLAAAEDNSDRAAVNAFREKLAAGEEELLPSSMVDRILGGESPIRVWREHRGMSVSALASTAGLSQPYVSQIEAGKREGTAKSLKAIADALSVSIDDLS